MEKQKSHLMVPKYDIVQCKVCPKTFKRSTRKGSGKLSDDVRPKNAVTCTTRCSKKNLEEKKFNKCKCGKIKTKHAKLCKDCRNEIKNKVTVFRPNKIHYLMEDHYLCNWACYITKSKCTKDTEKVTCLNCLHKIKRGDLNDQTL